MNTPPPLTDEHYVVAMNQQLEDERDARRYRKIRELASRGDMPLGWRHGYTPNELDSYVDAVMSATPPLKEIGRKG